MNEFMKMKREFTKEVINFQLTILRKMQFLCYGSVKARMKLDEVNTLTA